MNSQVIRKDDTYNEIGSWGVFDPISNISKVCGKMYARDILIKHSDDSLEVDTEWIADTNKNLLLKNNENYQG